MLKLRSTSTKGFTLIEILIALVIFAVAILGLSGMQIRSFSTSLDLGQRAVVTSAMQNFASKVRNNPTAVSSYTGTITAASCSVLPSPWCSDTASGVAEACSATEIAAFDSWTAFCGGLNSTDTSVGASADGGLPGAVVGWSVTVVCTDTAADCSAVPSKMRITASWNRRIGDTDGALSGTITQDVLETGTVSTSNTNVDQMVLELVP